MSDWKIISSGEHFPGIRILEDPDTGGYRIEFTNLEPRTKHHNRIFMAVLFALFALCLFAFIYLPRDWNGVGVAALWGSIIWGIGGAIMLDRPWKTIRIIDLDVSAQQFRVWRNGKITCERPIASFKNLSVDDHPDTALERQERRARKSEGPGPLEKQHCLFGWFGPEGTQQIDLIYRMEWPKRYSLREVAGAVNWVVKRMADKNKAAPAAKQKPEAPARAPTINPPLD
ncbi:hypothetical protein R2G56_05000 [Nitratireductor aquimarinus]|uniref:Uncharacterized protein n=1 Tax=Nitratireductor aquimarinus TaxID=889300 RepID=A0ABU4AHB8_9HYPH|nr:hypothetical protein [Nitratireductor aquimarinus]MDV6225637.1 hypothetical protein [Nitratireductor aquimarinus]